MIVSTPLVVLLALFAAAGPDTKARARAAAAIPSGSVNVRDCGAVGDGNADDTEAVKSALEAMAASGGRVIFPRGTYKITSTLTIPPRVVIAGERREATILTRAFRGDFIGTLGAYGGIENMTIIGQAASYGPGRGVRVRGSAAYQTISFAEIRDFADPCLEFDGNAGSGFVSTASLYHTTGALGRVAAIRIAGKDDNATPRHFIGTESGGCTLFDFGGANDLFVFGGYSNGLIFPPTASKVVVMGMRIGGAAGPVTIRGSAHKIKGSIFAAPVILAGTSIDFDSEVPDWKVQDEGRSNEVAQTLVSFTPAWKSTGAPPSLGNGKLQALYSRHGQLITMMVDLTFAANTDPGTGAWRFELPRREMGGLRQASGSGLTQNSGPGGEFIVVPDLTGERGEVQLVTTDRAGNLTRVGGTTKRWASGTSIRFSMSYFTE